MIDSNKLSTSLSALRAVSHPIRLSLLAYIDKNKVINVNKIYRKLKLEQSITSQHLRILRIADLVTTKRDGKFIYYSVNYKVVKNVVDSTNKLLSA